MRVLVLTFVATLVTSAGLWHANGVCWGALIRVVGQKLTVRFGHLIGCVGLKQFWAGKKPSAVVGLWIAPLGKHSAD